MSEQARQHLERVVALGRHLPDERNRGQWLAAFDEAERAAWDEALAIEDPRAQGRAMDLVVQVAFGAPVPVTRSRIMSPANITADLSEAAAAFRDSLSTTNERTRAALQRVGGMPAALARRLRELAEGNSL